MYFHSFKSLLSWLLFRLILSLLFHFMSLSKFIMTRENRYLSKDLGDPFDPLFTSSWPRALWKNCRAPRTDVSREKLTRERRASHRVHSTTIREFVVSRVRRHTRNRGGTAEITIYLPIYTAIPETLLPYRWGGRGGFLYILFIE